MTPLHILAKSSSQPEKPLPRETLAGHTLDTMNVAKTMMEEYGGAILGSAGLAGNTWFQRLCESSIRGAFLHDLGKANSHFQRMLRNASSPLQAVRHEIVSLWIVLRFKEMASWIFEGVDDIVRDATLFAVGGHHLKLKDLGALDPRPGSGSDTMQVLAGHTDLQLLFRYANDYFAKQTLPPRLGNAEINLIDNPFYEVSDWLLDAGKRWKTIDRDSRVFVGLVKGTVIAADIASSILPREGKDPVLWVREVLGNTAKGGDLAGIASERLEGKTLREFQKEVAYCPDRVTLVTAGCGSGKTTAAYLWAARRAQGRKFFYCYPTTGTASQGYIDYVFDPHEMASGSRFAALLHSRASVDIERLLDNGVEDDQLDYSIRMDALASWDVSVVVCTADTVLGLMQNYSSALFKFPSIANGVFVFDEIHTYDDRMFSMLLRFLSTFKGVPILLMTASLPPGRRNDLEATLSSTGENLKTVNDSSGLETVKRYRISPPAIDIPWSKVNAALDEGQKVLLVVNTVDRAVKLARVAADMGHSPLLYHSRYRYIDRIDRHGAVIDAFSKESDVAALAITTQVCEISLDISADLLISEMAPVPSLIQRLGRLNRRVDPDFPGEPKTAIFIEPDIVMPYEAKELAQSKEWLKMIGNKIVSQRDLDDAFKEIAGGAEVDTSFSSAWLDGGPFSSPAPLRDGGFTVQIIMAEDSDACKDGRGKPNPKCVTGYSIPMPLTEIRKEILQWRRVAAAFEAPPGRIEYSKKWGARWQK